MSLRIMTVKHITYKHPRVHNIQKKSKKTKQKPTTKTSKSMVTAETVTLTPYSELSKHT